MSAARLTEGGALRDPSDAMAELVALLAPVQKETVPADRATGRVLAEPVRSDRPSPPCDVSAMDGYAVRLQDVAVGRLPVAGEALPGHAPVVLKAGQAVRIFTGGAVPVEADVVIKRESLQELGDVIVIPGDVRVAPGMNIRRCGENGLSNEIILPAGRELSPAAVVALAAFGANRPMVHRRVRVGIVVTGDELLHSGTTLMPWQICDSNGPGLAALLGDVPWIEVAGVEHAADEKPRVREAIVRSLERCDALLLTGGVSMGDRDYVPEVIEAIGGRIVFHKVAQRPGKPMLGAIAPGGQTLLGLPGNPVSALVTARRWGAMALRKLAGFGVVDPPAVAVALANADDATLALWWHRLVRILPDGRAELLTNRGSGDVVAIGQSDGFVEIPPGACGAGPWRFYPWRWQ